MNRICIKNAKICPVDRDALQTDGHILIEDGRIKSIAQQWDLGFEDVDYMIDAKNMLAVPGFVNMHTHAAMTLFRNYADDKSLQDWLFNHIIPLEDKLTDGDVYWASCLAILEMIASGITCFCDMYQSMEHVARAVDESGMKANLSRGLICAEDSRRAVEKDRRLLENIELYHNWNGHERIKVSFGVHSVYTCSVEYLKYVRQTVEKLDAQVHLHLDETQKEHQDCLRTFSKTPTMHLDHLGLLNFSTIAAHCVHVTEEDMDVLQRRRCYVVHNPSSNMKLGSGIAPVQRMLDKGIQVCLGTDGASSNNSLNMMKEMTLASFLGKGSTMQPLALPAVQVLEMATSKGGKASGFSMTGRLEEGWAADIVLIDYDKPHLYPLNNAYSAIVYAAQASDVHTVMCNGRLLYHKGQHLTMDYEKIRGEMGKVLDKIY